MTNQSRPPSLFLRPRSAVAVLAVILVALAGRVLSADGAGDSYKKALAKEDSLRTAPAPTLVQFRATMAAYEDVVLKYYTSGYCDNALWQGAGVALSAYERYGQDADKKTGVRLLNWLKKEYPASPFVKKVDDRIRAFDAVHPPGAENAAAPLAPAAIAPSKPAAPVASPPAPTPSAPAHATATPPPAPSATRTSTAPSNVRSIEYTTIPKGGRITITMDAGVSYAGDRIPNPDRVFVDLHNAVATDAVIEHAQTITSPLIATLRCGAQADQTVRVVLELKGHPRHAVYLQYNPFRVIIDLEGEPASISPPPAAPAPVRPDAIAEAQPNDESGPIAIKVSNTQVSPKSDVSVPPLEKLVDSRPAPAPASPTSAGSLTLGRQLGLSVSRIVIDAGHGGHDPGAQANGITESELTLDVAQRLQKLLLDRPGTDVVLTRSTDEYVPLQERTAIANREGADLFLSIHANASTEPIARGVETYFLNFTTTHDSEEVAARENDSSDKTMGNLPDLVKSITLNNKLAESKELATMVQSSMMKRLKTENATVRDLGVKQAPFVVLIGAEMPSVLAEISFLTNRTEAALLKQSAYRQKIAQALFDAVARYQDSLKKTVAPPAKDRQQ